MIEIVFAVIVVPLSACLIGLPLILGRGAPRSTCHAMACGGLEPCAGCPRRAARKVGE